VEIALEENSLIYDACFARQSDTKKIVLEIFPLQKKNDRAIIIFPIKNRLGLRHTS